MKYDWEKIEQEYVSGKMTMEKLAEKYKISISTFQKKAIERKFTEKRRKYAEKVQEKALARAQARDARTLGNLSSALDKAARLLNKYMTDENTLHGRIVNHMDGKIEEVRVEKLDTKALRDMTSALREATAAMQLIRPNGAQEEEQGGVVVLPEREAEG